MTPAEFRWCKGQVRGRFLAWHGRRGARAGDERERAELLADWHAFDAQPFHEDLDGQGHELGRRLAVLEHAPFLELVHVRTGETILGEKTWGQLADFVRVCQHDDAQLVKALAGCQAWQDADAKAFGEFSDKAHALSADLPPLVEKAGSEQRGHDANDAIDLVGNVTFDALKDWRRRASALELEFRDKGKAYGCEWPSGATPQPSAADPQMDALHKAKGATDTIEHAAEEAGEVAKAAVTTAARIATPVLVGLGIVGGVVVLRAVWGH